MAQYVKFPLGVHALPILFKFSHRCTYGIFVKLSMPPTEAPRSECVTEKYFFLFLNQNICCGYSKEPSR